MEPLYLSYYTRNSPYENEAKGLIRTLEKYGLEYRVDPLDNLGSWGKNCLQKAGFLLNYHKKESRPLVWIDADARFIAMPTWFSQNPCDIAFRTVPYMDRHWLCSGTLYLGPSPKTHALLKNWVQECAKYKEQPRSEGLWDQVALQRALKKHPNLNTRPLPDTYVRICHEERSEQDVIVHYQASNAYSQFIDDKTPVHLLPNTDSETLYHLSKNQPIK